ncbi:MAG: VWA domain-containing protein [Calditrichaeota bacterium]|nr:VWA domain-containing protein [Candidatus Cloacimonadota bacterium]MCA9787076.1 VWA domain-containing protein [Candidatus Cloacimonadota bacterium]MCB1046561.1 VWA domain-containing protein [Calditrichota bacterium]MCB9474777.1 VWA domain-containing protein [Candidatus Delongbacteria bacterium]
MIRFEFPVWLNLLWALPLLAILVWRQASRTRRLLAAAGRWNVLSGLLPGWSAGRLRLKGLLSLLGLGMMVVALAGPQLGTRKVEVERKGVDVVLAVDVSQSMAARDLAPDRMARTRHSIRQLLESLHGDRVALVPFSGAAFLQNPLTSDYNMVGILVDLLKPGLIPRPGTDLAAPINTALELFNREEEDQGQHRVLVVLSDGEDFEGQWEEAAKKAVEAGVRIFAVGMASLEGSPVPDPDRPGSLKTDRQGNIVLSRLNEEVLVHLVDLGQGSYFRSSAGGDELIRIRDEIDQMDKKALGSQLYSGWQHRYQWFLAAGLLLQALALLLPASTGKSKSLIGMEIDQ